MRDKDLLKLLPKNGWVVKKNGWVVKRVRGSHHVMQKDNKIQIIAVHNKDVPIGLLEKILKETGLK